MATDGKASNSLVPYSCIFIDASWRHFLTAMLNCLGSPRSPKHEDELRRKLNHDIAALFSSPADDDSRSLVCLSVRTGFDLFLRLKRFPRGSEVIMSAVNIPGMVDIVREHGLVPVPWDIELDTLSPADASLDRLITPRSVVVVLSHLFGKKCLHIDRAVQEAHERGLYFVEDCAESFDVFEYTGHPQADLVLYSFGVMKHFTAFGGAVCTIRDRGLFDAMVDLYEKDPVQSRLDYFKKLWTSLTVAVGVNVPLVMQLGVPLANLIGLDYKARVIDMLRGFPPGRDLWTRLRKRPCIPLMLVLRERLSRARPSDLRRTREKGEFVRRLLPVDGIMVPGRAAANGGHDWLFPIIVDDPDLVAKRLNSLGVDALTKATQLTVVDRKPPTDGTKADGSITKQADYLLDHVVYLPVHKNVPYEYLQRICKAVALAVQPPVETSPHDRPVQRSKL